MKGISNIWPDWFVYSAEEPMFYTSLLFWIFFTFFLGVYSLLYSKMKVRNTYLLVISLFLYFKINGFYFMLLLLSSGLNYGAGLAITKTSWKKTLLGISIAINLLLLGFYKYAIFITELINTWFATKFQVINWLTYLENQLFGSQLNVFEIILPIGISFYTFQAISYLVDVFRKDVEPVRNFLDFSFYLSFFPQLVAGPIVRASYFIPQLYQKYKLSQQEFSHAIYLILKGLAKKLIIADFLAINLIDRVFESPLSYSGLENLLSLYSYSIQIYFDFSGYTDIAIGIALILGFKIPVNFNSPYQATSLTDFWHRWHISLSTWLKDYLYIPLGGNRKGLTRTTINLLITMILGGLWHGANLRFIIWGAIHGVALVFEKLAGKFLKWKANNTIFPRIVSIFITFNLVSFAWLFFRVESNDKIRQWFYQLSNHFNPGEINLFFDSYINILFAFFVGLILIWTPFKIKEKIRGSFIASPVVLQVIMSVIILIIIAFVSQSSLQPFIYFRF